VYVPEVHEETNLAILGHFKIDVNENFHTQTKQKIKAQKNDRVPKNNEKSRGVGVLALIV
jgi:hypothetical protein